MIKLIDSVIKQALIQGVVFDTITLDFWSYEEFTKELSDEFGKQLNKLTGYKGYKVDFKLEGAFGRQYFYINLR